MISACNSNKNVNENDMKSEDEKLNAIFPKGEKGPSENFTGNAFNYGLVAPDSTFTTAVGNVYFEPGARSNWHSHPAGQILIITDGVGYHQIEGETHLACGHSLAAEKQDCSQELRPDRRFPTAFRGRAGLLA